MLLWSDCPLAGVKSGFGLNDIFYEDLDDLVILGAENCSYQLPVGDCGVGLIDDPTSHCLSGLEFAPHVLPNQSKVWCPQLSFLTSGWVRLPAEFKHIIERRK